MLVTDGGDGCSLVTEGGDGCGVVTEGGDCSKSFSVAILNVAGSFDCFEHQIWNVKAIFQRSHFLTHLVYLHIQNVHSVPKFPKLW